MSAYKIKNIIKSYTNLLWIKYYGKNTILLLVRVNAKKLPTPSPTFV